MGIPIEILEIIDEFRKKNIIGKPGKLLFGLDELTIDLETKDIMGGVLQEWFGSWMISQGYDVSVPENSQAFPDYYVNQTLMLESKSFYHGKTPAFDVAAYSNYVESLNYLPQRLDATYVVFSYEMTQAEVFIRGIWLKNIWEMVGSSPKNILQLQVKRGYPTNIRPKNFLSSRTSVFKSRFEFCEHLHRSALHFGGIRGHDENWFVNLQKNYHSTTGTNL